MTKVDHYAGIGCALEMLAMSPYHRQFELGWFLENEIFPPMRQGQSRFYLTRDGRPSGFLTWAMLSETVEREVHQTGRSIQKDEWACGDQVYFSDWIAPFSSSREIAKDVSENLFPNHVGSSLRRNMDSSVRRVNRWTGANVRRRKRSSNPDKAGSHFVSATRYPGLRDLVSRWVEIRDELRGVTFDVLPIDRQDKSHSEVVAEVKAHMDQGGAYGWLQGWGAKEKRRDWTQLGLVVNDTPIPYLAEKMARTQELLSAVSGIKVAAILRMKPGTMLETHTHPELIEEGLLQMHLTLEAAAQQNFAYLNVDDEFRRHIPGEAFVFDGSKPHFAINASNRERVILYLEFDPAQVGGAVARADTTLTQ